MKNYAPCVRAGSPTLSYYKTRGAFSILAALLLPLIILFCVLALDGGRLYWESNELQRIADLAALDAAQGSSTLFNYSENKSANNTALNIELSTLAEQSKEQNLPKPDWNVATAAQQRGIHTNSLGIREACALDATTATSEIPLCSTGASYNVVEVIASKTVCLSIIANLKALFPDSHYSAPSTNDSCLTPGFIMSRKAYASRPLYVTFSVGSKLLNLSTADSPLLAPLLTSLGVNPSQVELVSYRGLADASLSVEELLGGLNVDLSAGTLDAVLDDTEVTVGSLASAMLSALSSSNQDADVAAALSLLANSSADLLKTKLPLRGEQGLLYIPNGLNEKGVLISKIPVGTLLDTALLLANGDNAIALPGTSLKLGNLINADLSLSIGEPPQIAIGMPGCSSGEPPDCDTWYTEARTAQIKLNLDLGVNVLPTNPALASLNVGLIIESVSGRAGINSVTKVDEGYEAEVSGFTSLLKIGPKDPTRGILSISLLPNMRCPGHCSALENILGTLLKGVFDLLGFLLGGNLVSADDDLLLAIGNASNLNNLSIPGARASLVPGEPPPTWPSDPTAVLRTNTGDAVSDLLSGIFNSVNSANLEGKKCGLLGCSSATIPLVQRLTQPIQNSLTPVNNALGTILEQLGISVNTLDVEILSIEGGTAELII